LLFNKKKDEHKNIEQIIKDFFKVKKSRNLKIFLSLLKFVNEERVEENKPNIKT
jgi:hypothetical protein